MKKILIMGAMCTLVTTAALTSCSDDEDDVNATENNVSTKTDNGESTTSTPKTYWDKPIYVINQDGDTTEKYEYDENLNKTYYWQTYKSSDKDIIVIFYYTYDENGNRIKEENIFNGERHITEYEYAPTTNIKIRETKDGEEIYACNIDNEIIETSYTGMNSPFRYVLSFYYNENNERQKYTYHKRVDTYTDASLTMISKSEIYDDKENIIWTYNATIENGKIKGITEKYKGQTIYERNYTYDNQEIEEEVREYYYSALYGKGNGEDGDLLSNTTYYTIYLDEDLNYWTEMGRYSEDGTKIISNTREFDNQNRVTKETYLDTNCYIYEYFDNYVKESHIGKEWNDETQEYEEYTKTKTTYYLVK